MPLPAAAAPSWTPPAPHGTVLKHKNTHTQNESINECKVVPSAKLSDRIRSDVATGLRASNSSDMLRLDYERYVATELGPISCD